MKKLMVTVALGSFLLLWGGSEPTQAKFKPGEFYASGPTKAKRIALTFDDGPGPETIKFLDLLDRYNVKATFFLLGEMVPSHAEVAREIFRRGHELGSHTFKHTNYNARLKKIIGSGPEKKSEAAAIPQVKSELRADMEKTQDAIKNATGIDVQICRIPHGIDRPWIKDVAQDVGLTLINWTYGTDWNPQTYEELLPGYIKAIRPGAIFLFHDSGKNRSKTLALTEALIQTARENGYEMVTVTQLFDSK